MNSIEVLILAVVVALLMSLLIPICLNSYHKAEETAEKIGDCYVELENLISSLNSDEICDIDINMR